MEQSVNPPAANGISIPRARKLDFMLSRIDLAAFVISLLGISLLGLVAMVRAVIDLARLIPSLWSNSLDRWLIILLGAAIVWVLVRWKKSCAA